ncbi:MAG TPA: hypothetical protein PLM93_11600 [Sulfuricurvum sp.]|nr:MAG: hypothetical protein B7Y30_11755 [Campylobacterales bacterium 16-40-21]OZA02024.1 MAG: hypothetical protein B7X89_11140 [Sulfuricurvum sp. 17-40-25]HQS67819.1 hypothetical protein [Sulfuricurvum sp.]HQT37677.1 hypothetical protein [Sulfuricurvum sp.]
MKKFLILIPVGLLATAGLVWSNYGHSVTQKSVTPSTKILTEDPVKLFSLGERSVRKMIRDGDEKSISSFHSYSDALDAAIMTYTKLGIDTHDAKEMLSQYKIDNNQLTQTASLYSQKLHTYSQFEQNQEKAFQVSLDQIGLYELKVTFKNLNKARVDYIKEPSQKTQAKYEDLTNEMSKMINELYLDTSIEQPLIAYIENHAHYFETVASIYTATGLESVNRLHTNSYRIKAQLELFPKS